MRLLFLDIDGVLNSAQSARLHARERERAKRGEPAWLDALGRRALRDDEFCPIACSNLLTILEEFPDLYIVVSSSWRFGRTVDELKEVLAKAGIPKDRVIDKTPYLSGKQRGVEIAHWMLQNTKVPPGSIMIPIYQVSKWVILDDDSDMIGVRSHFIKTDYQVGLDFITARKVIDFLKD